MPMQQLLLNTIKHQSHHLTFPTNFEDKTWHIPRRVMENVYDKNLSNN